MTKPWVVALGLALLFIAGMPAYAIADGIERAQAERPGPVQIGQLQLPSAAQWVTDIPNSVQRPRDGAVQSVPASGFGSDLPSVRKLPGRLAP